MAYPVVVLIVPRRAGKTAMDLARKMQRCAADPGAMCWYTAQTGGDAGVTFRQDWVPAVQSAFSAKTAKVRLSNGSESITLPSRGSQLGLFAPTETALHGQNSDDVTVDEAWAQSAEKGALLEAAIRPTMATRKRRQLWIVSAGGTWESTWLLAWRELGRALTGPDQGVAFFEWHPEVDDEGRPAVDLDDPAVWADTHPAVGHTIELDTLREDRASMTADLFHRSYLDIFSSTTTGRHLPALAWEKCADPAARLDPDRGNLHLAYDVSEDRQHGALVMTQRADDGRIVAEVTDTTGVDHERPGDRDGIAWMPDRAVELRDRYRLSVAADSFGPASTVTRKLDELGVDVHQLDTREMVDACAELLDDVLTGDLVHRGQGVLDAAAGAIGRRQLGDGFAWSRRMSTADPSPVLALTIAAHRARHYVAAAPTIYLGRAS